MDKKYNNVSFDGNAEETATFLSLQMCIRDRFQSGTNVNNELITFQSPSLMTEVVKRLRLDMNYFVPEKFHRQVAYGLTLPRCV